MQFGVFCLNILCLEKAWSLFLVSFIRPECCFYKCSHSVGMHTQYKLNSDMQVDGDIKTSLNSLRSIMDEEEERRRLIKLHNLNRHSQFSGTFTRLAVVGASHFVDKTVKVSFLRFTIFFF